MHYQSICDKYGNRPLRVCQILSITAMCFSQTTAVGQGSMIGLIMAIGAEALIKKCNLMRGIGMTRASKRLQRIQASFVVAGAITGAAFQFGPGLVHKYKMPEQKTPTQREALMKNTKTMAGSVRPVKIASRFSRSEYSF